MALSSLRSRGTMTRFRTAGSIVVLQSGKRLVLPVALLLALIVGLGLLVTKVLYDDWPFTAEDAFNRELAGLQHAGQHTGDHRGDRGRRRHPAGDPAPLAGAAVPGGRRDRAGGGVLLRHPDHRPLAAGRTEDGRVPAHLE